MDIEEMEMMIALLEGLPPKEYLVHLKLIIGLGIDVADMQRILGNMRRKEKIATLLED